MFVIKTAETLTGWSAADYSHSQREGGSLSQISYHHNEYH